MDVTEIIFIFSPIMPFVVGGLKRLFPNKNPRYFSIGFSALIAITFGVLSLVVDHQELIAFLAELGAVSGFVFAIGTGLYKVQK